MIEAELIAGRATGEGTRRYADRFADLPGHFRRPDALWLSSLGLGTRGGDPGGADDLGYRSAVSRAVEVGVNVFDTALSYRMQTSERALGRALGRAFAEGAVARDEICVMSKGGYLTIDIERVRDRREARAYLYTTYVDSGIVDPDELAHGRHTLSRRFLEDQIERSRRNLGLETIDVYCLQDPEIQLEEKGPDAFRRLLIEAIEMLEEAAHKGSIGAYGVSTWNGLLVPHTERGHLSLAELFDTALDVGGPDHHMRAIQLPYSVAMAEAQGLESQFAAESHATGALDTLRDTGTAVFAIAPLVQGRAVRGLPRFVKEASPELERDAQVALQFARSAPAITSALVGMRSVDHVDENLAVARSAPLSERVIAGLFDEAQRAER